MIFRDSQSSGQPPAHQSAPPSRPFFLRNGLPFMKLLGAGSVGVLMAVTALAMIDAKTRSPFEGISHAIISVGVEPQIELAKRQAEIQRCMMLIQTAHNQQKELNDAAKGTAVLGQMGNSVGALGWGVASWFLNDPAQRREAQKRANMAQRAVTEALVLNEQLARTQEYVLMLKNGGQIIPGTC